MFRPDAPAFSAAPLSRERPIVTLSTDDEPEIDNDGGELEVGTTWLHEDTGSMFYYTGSAWKPVTVQQVEALKLNLLFDIHSRLLGSE
jgi:hypothetical protein